MLRKEKIANTFVSAILNSNGALDRTRTGMTLRSADFESTASTYFATRASFKILQQKTK